MPKSIKKIKLLIALIAVLIVGSIIGLIVFVSNVNINKGEGIDVGQISNQVQNINYTGIENNTVETPKADENLKYSIVKTDKDGMYQITLVDNKLYLKITDSDKFSKEYKNSKLDKNNDNEINKSDFLIEDFNIGKVGDDTYLVLSLKDNEFTLLNLDDAIKNNDFSNYAERIILGVDIQKIENVVVEKENGEKVDTILLCSSNGKNYDVSNFVE